MVEQLAGVQCAGNPHFWVNEDGSYQEEGQKNTKGCIWGKVTFYFFANLSQCSICIIKLFYISLFRLERSLYVLYCRYQFLLILNVQIHVGFYPPIWLPDQFLITLTME